MDDTQVGWIAAIIIGGVAGWLAEQFMKSGMGLVMNIVLGIVGAAVASAILSFFGVHLGGWIGYLIAGFIGAVLLIWIWRMIAVRRGNLNRAHLAHATHDLWRYASGIKPILSETRSRLKTGREKIAGVVGG